MKEYDIYISYDNADNKPLIGSDKGWITYFKTFLELILEQILNKKPTFLFFPNNENPSSVSIENVQILVCILSPSFVNSKNCIEDVDIFLSSKKNDHAHAEKTIFKVGKAPISRHQEPSSLQSLRSYELYKREFQSQDLKEAVDFFAAESERTFWMNLVDLAYDVSYDLCANKSETYSIGFTKKKSPHTVYLAQTGNAHLNERNYIKRELQKHGFKVLPDQPFPANLREAEVFIKKNLQKSVLSIHLIGDNYGRTSQNEQSSIVELESKIAEEYGAQIHAENQYNDKIRDFKQIIWVSPEGNKTDQRQKSFIEKLIEEAESLEDVEILQTPIEDLKSIIKKEVLMTSIKRTFAGKKSNKNKLYLVYDKIDKEEGKSMAKYLENQGVEVLIPAFDGELMEIRQHHINNLRICDAAIIHYGKVNEQWVQMKFLDLLKSSGFGRSKPLTAKAIYASEGAKINPEFYKNFDIDIITSGANLHPESFHSFLAKLDRVFYE
ncbi:MAG TPA: hypothetical protein VD908_15585 [Cytophagales bacterium]|nr:hypothetical protein [Cytophagales bacterium]